MRTLLFCACACFAAMATAQTLKPILNDEDVGAAPLTDARPPSPPRNKPAPSSDADVDVFALPTTPRAEQPVGADAAAPLGNTGSAAERGGTPKAQSDNEQKTTKLLPADPRGESLPAAVSHAKRATIPLLWKDTPLEEALDEIARFRGVEIRYMRSGAATPVAVSGDHRATDTHSLIRTIARQASLSFEFSGGAYVLTGATAAPATTTHPAIPVINSRLYSVAPDMAESFLGAYLQSKNPHGRLTFVGAQADGQNSYRVVDSPAVLDRMSDTLAAMMQERSQAVANLTPLRKEREKLLRQRTKLVERYLQQQ